MISVAATEKKAAPKKPLALKVSKYAHYDKLQG